MDFTEYILNWDSNLKFAKEMQIGKFLACAGGSIKTFQFLSFVCPENYVSSLMVPVHIVLSPGHTTAKAPHPIGTAKLCTGGPDQYFGRTSTITNSYMINSDPKKIGCLYRHGFYRIYIKLGFEP